MKDQWARIVVKRCRSVYLLNCLLFSEKFKAYMKAHQFNDNTLQNATVLDVVQFYHNLIQKFVSWVSQLLLVSNI